MPTLLLRLCGPMQSWGTRSRFSERDTELEPSKSGVIGLLCAALGRPRDVPVDDLAGLRMGVRVDQEGTLAREYHTAGGGANRDPRVAVVRASGKVSSDAVLSNRYYLADADFLVGLEHADRRFLEEIEAALRSPRWQLFLGRKSFVPALPVYLSDGIRETDLETSLDEVRLPPFPGFEAQDIPTSSTRFVVEQQPYGSREVRMDRPIGAAFATRTFGPRWVLTTFSKATP